MASRLSAIAEWAIAALSSISSAAAREGLTVQSPSVSPILWSCCLAGRIFTMALTAGLAAPGEAHDIITFDMATTVQAWGKVPDDGPAMSPSRRVGAVDKKWARRHMILLPSMRYYLAAGPKGYGLMMMTIFCPVFCWAAVCRQSSDV